MTLTAAQQQRKPAANAPENIIAFSRAMFDHAHEYRKVYNTLVTTQVWPHVRQRIQNVLVELIRRECTAEMKRLPEIEIEASDGDLRPLRVVDVHGSHDLVGRSQERIISGRD